MIIITNEDACVKVVSFFDADNISTNVLIHAYASHYAGDRIAIVDNLRPTTHACFGEAGSQELIQAINRTWPLA